MTKRTKRTAPKEAAPNASPAAVAVFTKPEPVAPANRKGESTVDNPVGVTWVLCLNATTEAGSMPARKDLTRLAIDAGVAYYTARTQVQRFRRWVADGADPKDLPRGINLG